MSTDDPETGPIDEADHDDFDELPPLLDDEEDEISSDSAPVTLGDLTAETEEVIEYPDEDTIIETPRLIIPEDEDLGLEPAEDQLSDLDDAEDEDEEIVQISNIIEEIDEDDLENEQAAFREELSPILNDDEDAFEEEESEELFFEDEGEQEGTKSEASTFVAEDEDVEDEDEDDGFGSKLLRSTVGAILPPPESTKLAKSPQELAVIRRKRRARAWKLTKFALYTLCVFLILGVIGGVFAYFYSMPRYEMAQTLDMDRIDDLEVASKIVDRNGKELGRIYVQNRQPIPFDQVSQHFVHALLAAEDSRFYDHEGIDPKGIARAIFQIVKTGGEVNQGASTITQQLARNAFDLREKSISRKVTEAFLARRIEEEIGNKDKIMELYMNRIYFGDGYYGIAAASEGFFGKKASELSIAEAATLAGVVRNPYFRGPRKFPDASKDTRDGVIRRMAKLDFIEKDEREMALNTELKTVPKQPQTGKSQYVYDRVRQQVIDVIGGYETVSQGGYTIRTTIDMDVQRAAEEKLRSQLDLVESKENFNHQTLADYKALKAKFSENAAEGSEPPRPSYLQGSLLMIENKTGAIIALVGGRDFSDSMFDRTTQGRRPAGTAFLPFVYAAAFESGKFPGSLVDDTPMDQKRLQIGGLTGIVAEWGPEATDNTYENAITYRRALSKSAIGAAVRVGETARKENVIGLAKSAGMTFDGDLQRFNASLLGRSAVSMEELCKAYTIFPNAGSRPQSTYLIESITDASGIEVFRPEKGLTNRPTIDKYTAYQVASCLQDSLKTGSARKATAEYGLGDFPAAGKTGTEYGFTDNWFVGFTSEVTCAVWTGFDQTEQIYPLAFSADTVLPVWTEVINASTAAYPPRDFTPPSDAAQVEVCTLSGELATSDCFEIVENGDAATQVRTTFIEYLRPGTEIKSICSIHGRPGSKVLTGSDRITKTGENNGPQPIRVALLGADSGEPVIPVAMTVVGEDPYNSVMPVIKPKAPEPEPDPEIGPDGENPGEEPAPLRAIPVAPENQRPAIIARPVIENDPYEPIEGRVRLAPPGPIALPIEGFSPPEEPEEEVDEETPSPDQPAVARPIFEEEPVDPRSGPLQPEAPGPIRIE